MKNCFLISFFLVFICLFSTCKKKGERLPLVTTLNASGGGPGQIKGGGVVYFKGDGDLTQVGLCWSESPEPTIDNNKTEASTQEGNFSLTVAGLKANTRYYLRAYATNNHGTSYGETMEARAEPEVVTTVTDIDGNSYPVVKIGTKYWTTQNLRVSRYRNGDPIVNYVSNFNWSGATQGSFCYYQTSNTNKELYGHLYNFYAVNDPRSIAPAGWHVATVTDYGDLANACNGYYYAGGQMMAIHVSWYNNYNANNKSGFSALPGGERVWFDGSYQGLSYSASFWTGTYSSSYSAIAAKLSYDTQQLTFHTIDVRTGCSVRLVKD